MSSEGESEEFLSLEDDPPVEIKKKPVRPWCLDHNQLKASDKAIKDVIQVYSEDF